MPARKTCASWSARCSSWTSCSCSSSWASSTPARPRSSTRCLASVSWPRALRPTTAAIHIIRYGEEPRLMPGAATPYGAGDRDIVVVNYPVEWLRDINIVDTPGTNAIVRRARGDHLGVCPAGRPRPLRHLGRPALYRERAASSLAASATGARRSSSSSTRSTSTKRPTSRTCSGLSVRTPRRCWAASRPCSACRAGRRGRRRTRPTRTSAPGCGRRAASRAWSATSSTRWTSRSGCG